MSYPIGVDLGTTYSSVSYVDENGTPRVLSDSDGSFLVPSVVFFKENGEVIVGGLAKNSITTSPKRVVVDVKRHMGDDAWEYRVDEKKYGPADISSFILGYLKKVAERTLDSVYDTVITVPAYFLDKERRRTIEAAEKAGLNVLGIVNEPTAASLAYGLGGQGNNRTILVYDLGGGTFDVTLLKHIPEAENKIDVITTRGNDQLGGIDWDLAIAQAVDEQFKNTHGISPMEDSVAKLDLLRQCERFKRALSKLSSLKLTYHYSGKKINFSLKQTEFSKLTESLLNLTGDEVDLALEDAGINEDGVDLVLLVGGSCKMPIIQKILSSRFQKVQLVSDPDFCVSKGAAIQAARLGLKASSGLVRYNSEAESSLRRLEVFDVVPHSLGVLAVKNGNLCNNIVLHRGSKVPCEASRKIWFRLNTNKLLLRSLLFRESQRFQKLAFLYRPIFLRVFLHALPANRC